MTFNAKQARKGVKQAKLRKEKERLAKQEEDNKRFETQRHDAKVDLPGRMKEVLEWIKEQANEERTDGTFSRWSHYGGQDVYYRELVDLVEKELIGLGFAAKKKWPEHGEFRPADDCPLQDVWTYSIYINWRKQHRD